MPENTPKKKAQLILVGGRPMPNMLTILNEKPDIIVAITSRDKKEEPPFLESSAKELLKGTKDSCIIDTSFIVDAFKLDEIMQACESALNKYEGAQWLFNITGATTIMSLGAYEVAKKHPNDVEWWYLDTAHTSIVTQSGSKRNDDFFKITVNEYLTASYCSLLDGDAEDYRTMHEIQWLPFAQLLGTHPQLPSQLRDVLKTIRNINQLERRQITQLSPQFYELDSLPNETILMLEEAAKVGVIDNWSVKDSRCNFLLSELQNKFLDGTWLEVYTWKEIQRSGLFPDYQWGKKIVDRYNRRNQLDVSMIYKAQLLIVECKTGNDAFLSTTFQTIESISNALGRSFVTKLLVTSLPVTNNDVESRAKSSGIFIIQRDDLPRIGQKLEGIAKGDIRL